MRERHRRDTNVGQMAAKVKRIFSSFEACLTTITASRQRGFVAQGGLWLVHDITEDVFACKFEYELKLGNRKARHTIHKK